jgi:hypothetical protein
MELLFDGNGGQDSSKAERYDATRIICPSLDPRWDRTHPPPTMTIRGCFDLMSIILLVVTASSV